MVAASPVSTLNADTSAQTSELDLNLQAGTHHGVTGALSDSSDFPVDTTIVVRSILVMHLPFRTSNYPRTMMMIKVIPSLSSYCGHVELMLTAPTFEQMPDSPDDEKVVLRSHLCTARFHFRH
ncbi:hypothetical protein F4604DRAFT_1686644 [Suillus subluteus]|nr:hypothetical protein F4604DRAFT_1686644 [Suillus subluteus]